MAVRKIKKAVRAPAPLSVPPPEEAEEQVSAEDLQRRRVVRAMLFSRSPREIVFQMREQFGLSYEQTKRLIRSVRDENATSVAMAQKSGRSDQILSTRDLLGQMLAELATAKAEEARIAAENKRRIDQGLKPDLVYKPRRHLPKYAEILTCHDLVARLEGNYAPTKNLVVTGNVTTEILDLLGVSTAEEVAELIERGRIIEAHGEEV